MRPDDAGEGARGICDIMTEDCDTTFDYHIERIEVRRLSVPPHRPMVDSVQAVEALEIIEVELTTMGGLQGRGFTYTLGRGGAAVAAMVETLAPLLEGEDARHRERINERLWWGVHWVGRAGISQLAASAVDIALWDLRGVALGEPVWSLLGGARREVPAYNTDCGWLQHEPSQLVEEASAAIEAGFGAVKIKVGRATLGEDFARLAAVRSAIGDTPAIMIDANHGFTPAEALRRGRAFEEIGLAWFEEPVPVDNIEGHRQVKEGLSIPIALGESFFSLHEARRYIEAGLVDILQMDACRAGGFTALQKASALAETHDVVLAPHHVMELHAHAALGLHNAIYVEYIPAFSGAVLEPLNVLDGTVKAAWIPGTGVRFCPEYYL